MTDHDWEQAEPSGRLRAVGILLVVAAIGAAAVAAARTASEQEPALGVTAAPSAFVVASPTAPETPDEPVGTWRALPPGPLAARSGHTAVWTGTAMIVWGGAAPVGPGGRVVTVADGAAFSRGRWETLPPPPIAGRIGHTAVWTGTEMIIWGGLETGRQPLAEGGAAYNPWTRQWRPVPHGPLEPRSSHTAVWTGDEMIVWGGTVGAGHLAGAAYEPATDRWRPLAPAPFPARTGHVAVWSEPPSPERLLIWGGVGGVGEDAGAAYDPSTNRWARLAPAPLAPRVGAAGVWGLQRLYVWGGLSLGDSANPRVFDDAGGYDPGGDLWFPLEPGGPSPRTSAQASWTGERLLIWGGGFRAVELDGGLYDRNTGQWQAIARAPVQPGGHYAAVWTGERLLIWGGNRAQAAAYVPP